MGRTPRPNIVPGQPFLAPGDITVAISGGNYSGEYVAFRLPS